MRSRRMRVMPQNPPSSAGRCPRLRILEARVPGPRSRGTGTFSRKREREEVGFAFRPKISDVERTAQMGEPDGQRKHRVNIEASPDVDQAGGGIALGRHPDYRQCRKRPSSSGPGRRPFTAKTGVRFPLGAPRLSRQDFTSRLRLKTSRISRMSVLPSATAFRPCHIAAIRPA